jgi:hypothetical protein
VRQANRLHRLERRLEPGQGRITFHRCTEHDEITWEEHIELHRQRGEFLFTMDLGAANVRENV